MTQKTFFTIPPPPIGRRWDIYWRWNKNRLLTRSDGSDDILRELDAFCGENPWQRHRSPQFHSINSMKYALACLGKLSKDFPGKEFKTVAIDWREVEEPILL